MRPSSWHTEKAQPPAWGGRWGSGVCRAIVKIAKKPNGGLTVPLLACSMESHVSEEGGVNPPLTRNCDQAGREGFPVHGAVITATGRPLRRAFREGGRPRWLCKSGDFGV
jgi:hypothetical protein